MRKCGVLMPISCLWGDYSIGSFGESGRQFVDKISSMGFRYWQILPLSPIDMCNSPYKSTSAFAGEKLYIDLDILKNQGLLTQVEIDNARQHTPYVCEYDRLKRERIQLLRLASTRATNREEIESFAKSNIEIDNYCKYEAIKYSNGGTDWSSWKEEKYDKGIYFSEQFCQFHFFKQWLELKAYANSRGVELIGDMPIYVSYDSSDVWSNRDNFLLDQDGRPTLVAGVPPDYFTQDGQLWGNPIYNFKKMKLDGFKWWRNRIKYALTIFDGVRIDHFRAFSRYWGVPATATTAKEGKWYIGGGEALIDAIKAESQGKLIIAEDLGDIDSDVLDLLKYSGFPGMRVFQFGFLGEGDSTHKPYNYPSNCVAYTGTHDNNTLLGYMWELTNEKRRQVLDFLGYESSDWSHSYDDIIRVMYASHADTVILPIQDLLGYGSDTRINTPGRAEGNWTYRVTKEQMDSIDTYKYKKLCEIYNR